MRRLTRPPTIPELVEQKVVELPALPASVTKVLQEVEKPDPDFAKVDQYIGQDQSLAVKTLRVVNSPYYGLPGRIASVTQAILILGLTQVRNIALSVAAVSAFPHQTPKQRELVQSFWLHAFAASELSKRLAARAKLTKTQTEVVATAALLHDLGMLFVGAFFPDEYTEIRKRCAAGEDETVVEQDILGLSHAQIGARILLRWGLPPQLASLVEAHETPDLTNGSVPETILKVSDQLGRFTYGLEAEPGLPELFVLGLTAGDLPSLKQIAEEAVDQGREMLSQLAA